MRVPGRKLVGRVFAQAWNRFLPGAVVLGYHRIATPGWDPLNLAVTPENFDSQLECLKGLREIVPLRELIRRRQKGEPLDGCAALTFDDGYRDFLETALPILEAHDAPATAFIATGFTGGRFWWDEVAALLEPHPSSAHALELGGAGTARLRYDGLRSRDRRAEASRGICDELACAGEEEIGRCLAQLRAWAGHADAAAGTGALDWSQLESLAKHSLVELGAHTVSHGCLGRLTPEAQRAEVEGNRQDLESRTGAAVRVFSYPNGSYSPTTPRLVESLGFLGACSSRQASLTRRTDPYRIPRIWPPNAPASVFRRWIRTWIAGAAS